MIASLTMVTIDELSVGMVEHSTDGKPILAHHEPWLLVLAPALDNGSDGDE
jgi:hypothetical protein